MTDWCVQTSVFGDSVAQHVVAMTAAGTLLLSAAAVSFQLLHVPGCAGGGGGGDRQLALLCAPALVLHCSHCVIDMAAAALLLVAAWCQLSPPYWLTAAALAPATAAALLLPAAAVIHCGGGGSSWWTQQPEAGDTGHCSLSAIVRTVQRHRRKYHVNGRHGPVTSPAAAAAATGDSGQLRQLLLAGGVRLKLATALSVGTLLLILAIGAGFIHHSRGAPSAGQMGGAADTAATNHSTAAAVPYYHIIQPRMRTNDRVTRWPSDETAEQAAAAPLDQFEPAARPQQDIATNPHHPHQQQQQQTEGVIMNPDVFRDWLPYQPQEYSQIPHQLADHSDTSEMSTAAHTAPGAQEADTTSGTAILDLATLFDGGDTETDDGAGGYDRCPGAKTTAAAAAGKTTVAEDDGSEASSTETNTNRRVENRDGRVNTERGGGGCSQDTSVTVTVQGLVSAASSKSSASAVTRWLRGLHRAATGRRQWRLHEVHVALTNKPQRQARPSSTPLWRQQQQQHQSIRLTVQEHWTVTSSIELTVPRASADNSHRVRDQHTHQPLPSQQGRSSTLVLRASGDGRATNDLLTHTQLERTAGERVQLAVRLDHNNNSSSSGGTCETQVARHLVATLTVTVACGHLAALGLLWRRRRRQDACHLAAVAPTNTISSSSATGGAGGACCCLPSLGRQLVVASLCVQLPLSAVHWLLMASAAHAVPHSGSRHTFSSPDCRQSAPESWRHMLTTAALCMSAAYPALRLCLCVRATFSLAQPAQQQQQPQQNKQQPQPQQYSQHNSRHIKLINLTTIS